MDWDKLAEPFPSEDIEWRIGRDGQKKNGEMWAVALAYVTNRAIMSRLDQVCTPGCWKNEFRPAPDGGIMCGLSIKVDGEWVTKWDGAEKTNIEAVKGGMSGSMKRAAVQWGIGRYLYKLTETFIKIDNSGPKYVAGKNGKPAYKWHVPQLPSWALPPRQPSNTKPSVNITTEQKTRLKAVCDRNGIASKESKRDMMTAYGLDLTAPVEKIEEVLRKIEQEYKEAP